MRATLVDKIWTCPICHERVNPNGVVGRTGHWHDGKNHSLVQTTVFTEAALLSDEAVGAMFASLKGAEPLYEHDLEQALKATLDHLSKGDDRE